MAQPGRALGLGPRCRRFKSCRPDHQNMGKSAKSRAAFPVVPEVDQKAALTALAGAAEALLAVASAFARGNVSPVVPLSPARPSRPSLTVSKLVTMFIAAKTRQGRSDRYLRQVKTVLASFQKGRAKQLADLVTVEDVEAWLVQKSWSNRTKRNYRADLSTVFSWAIRRGLLMSNPAMAVDLASPEDTEIGIHTPDQVRQVLESARRTDPLACRILSIRYFTGVRSAEAARLREEDFKGDFLEVTAKKSKTRSRRLIRIPTNLRAWLAIGPPLKPMRTDRIRQAVMASGVPWYHNVTRHSFVSYHLALMEKPGQTALEAGHSEAILFKHYRALVTGSQAAAFFAIVPKEAEQSTVEANHRQIM